MGAASGTSWMRGGRFTRLRCAVSGHRWASTPTSSGAVVVLCGRCGELITAGFVDQAKVLGLADVEGRSFLGVASSCRLAVDLVAAVGDRDEALRSRLRGEATARPGDAVDALAQVAVVLSGMFDPQRPLRALQVVADAVERSAVEHELLELSRRPRPPR